MLKVESVTKLLNLDNIRNFFKEQEIRYLIQGLLVLYIAFWLPDVSYSGVASFNNVLVRLIFVLMIVVLCLIEEYTSAILLAMAFILSVQRLNRYKMENQLKD